SQLGQPLLPLAHVGASLLHRAVPTSPPPLEGPAGRPEPARAPMVSCWSYDRTRAEGQVSPLLRGPGPHDRPLVAPRSPQRPDAPLHDGGDGPVERGLPRGGPP